jgi:hypothetical protein
MEDDRLPTDAVDSIPAGGPGGKFNRHNLADLKLHLYALQQALERDEAMERRTAERLAEAVQDPKCHPRTLAMVRRIQIQERYLTLATIDTSVKVNQAIELVTEFEALKTRLEQIERERRR